MLNSIFILILSALIITGCDDSDSPDTPSSSLAEFEGTWQGGSATSTTITFTKTEHTVANPNGTLNLTVDSYDESKNQIHTTVISGTGSIFVTNPAGTVLYLRYFISEGQMLFATSTTEYPYQLSSLYIKQ